MSKLNVTVGRLAVYSDGVTLRIGSRGRRTGPAGALATLPPGPRRAVRKALHSAGFRALAATDVRTVWAD